MHAECVGVVPRERERDGNDGRGGGRLVIGGGGGGGYL